LVGDVLFQNTPQHPLRAFPAVAGDQNDGKDEGRRHHIEDGTGPRTRCCRCTDFICPLASIVDCIWVIDRPT